MVVVDDAVEHRQTCELKIFGASGPFDDRPTRCTRHRCGHADTDLHTILSRGLHCACRGNAHILGDGIVSQSDREESGVRVAVWRQFRYVETDGIGRITFTRPERLNSLTFEVYEELRELTAELKGRSNDVRALVIAGEGRGFCSGGDVEEIIGELLKADVRAVYEFASVTGACVRNIREMPQPVVASVNGIAAGAGAVLALACDFRILAASARFEFLFTRVGLSGGDMGVCWLLPRIVGLGRATEMLMLGDRVSAQRALDAGLATAVVDDAELHTATDDLVNRLLTRAPWGVAMTKEMLNRSAAMDYSSAIQMETWTQTMLMLGQDFREFHRSFTAGRAPTFEGR
jgi:enoyl-CoA hydratase/carnithine racemase